MWISAEAVALSLKDREGWGCHTAVEHMSSMCQALGSVPSTIKQDRQTDTRVNKCKLKSLFYQSQGGAFSLPQFLSVPAFLNCTHM